MLFHNLDFLLSLAIVFAGYLVLSRAAQNVLLLVFSYLFYAAWDWRFTLLLVASSLVNYFFAPAIARCRRHDRLLLGAAIVLNLLPLAYFKYAGFVSENAVALLHALGADVSWATLETINPVGISFFTFQAISYLVDVYRGKTRPHFGSARALADVALYIAFFPQLIAGPIERSTHLLGQLLRRRHVSFEALQTGVWLFALGLALKTGIADVVSPLVDRVFADLGQRSLGDLYIGTLGFAIQIFCDFAGYTFMARGIAAAFGFELVVNFRQPYLSASFSDFWRRWHVSLSEWVRDYVYIPLGGSQLSPTRTGLNLVAVMTVMGLWHGAGWTFVAWGLLHGAYLALERVLERPLGALRRCPGGAVAYGAIVFHGVLLGWYLFRADDFFDAWQGMRAAISTLDVSLSNDLYLDAAAAGPFATYLVYFIVHELPCWHANREVRLSELHPAHRVAMIVTVTFLILAAGGSHESPFIYFQF